LEFGSTIDLEAWDEDFDDSSGDEREAIEEEVADRATASRTIAGAKHPCRAINPVLLHSDFSEVCSEDHYKLH